MVSFELTTPERIAYQSEAVSVTLPTVEGEITVMQKHIPLLAVLAPGMVTVKKTDGTEEYLAVGGGFVQIRPFSKNEKGTHVVALADSADRSEELTVEAVEAARERARMALSEAERSDAVAFGAAAVALEREVARLKVVRKRHHPRAT